MKKSVFQGIYVTLGVIIFPGLYGDIEHVKIRVVSW